MAAVRKGPVLLTISALALFTAGCAPVGPVDRAARLVRLHREAEALGTLRARLAEHPDDLAARRFYVRILAFTGDIEGARREVSELEKRMPGDPVPWIELGHAYELGHRFDEALAAYDAAASVAPSSPAGPREGGMRAARWGEAEDAAPRLDEAIARGAHDAETFHALGLVRLKLREPEQAEIAYRRGIAADPNATECWLGIATVAVVRNDAAGALAAYDVLASQRPAYAAAQLGRAWALAKLGRPVEANAALDRATALGAPKVNVDKQRSALRGEAGPL